MDWNLRPPRDPSFCSESDTGLAIVAAVPLGEFVRRRADLLDSGDGEESYGLAVEKW